MSHRPGPVRRRRVRPLQTGREYRFAGPWRKHGLRETVARWKSSVNYAAEREVLMV